MRTSHEAWAHISYVQSDDETYDFSNERPDMSETTYTPPPVTGYRTLTQFEVDLMNRIKAKGDELGALFAELEQFPKDGTIDFRWLAIGKTHCQQGIMAAVRAVAQPSNF